MLTKMVSWKSVLSLTLAFLSIFLSSPSHFASSTDVDGVKNSSNPLKVSVSVYYEALNQSCASFIVRNLASIFNDDLIGIINLRMVPWGNAQFNQTTNTTICQNGPEECHLNTIQACAIDVWSDLDKYYALIYCIEFLVIEGRHQDWETCFNSLGLSKLAILDCYNSGNGTKIGMAYEKETEHLNPPQHLMPWIVVNNKSLGNDYENFATYVCNAYKGHVMPNACNSHVAKNSSSRKANSFHPVLFKNECKNLESLRPKIKRKPSARKALRIMGPSTGLK